MNMNEDKIDLG